MTPVNSKSLLVFTFSQMEKLQMGEITNQTAREQSNLIKQANNLLKYELDRAKTLIELANHNDTHVKKLELRNIESKNFD